MYAWYSVGVCFKYMCVACSSHRWCRRTRASARGHRGTLPHGMGLYDAHMVRRRENLGCRSRDVGCCKSIIGRWLYRRQLQMCLFFKTVYIETRSRENPVCFERCLGLVLRPSDMTTYRQLKRKHSSTSCLSWYICECSIAVMQGAPRYRRNMCCTCKAWPPRVPACDDIMQRRNGCMDSSVVPLNARTLRLSWQIHHRKGSIKKLLDSL